MGSTAPPFAIKDEPVENLRPLKVRVIGAGFSGIYLGIRIPQRLRNIDLQIYEKNEGIGGTWFENRYPGCACDIPSHSYQYSFAPNPNWSSLYAPAPEICSYLESVAEKYGARRFIKLSHKVIGCKWDDRLKQWHVKVEKTNTGEIIEEDVDILISARGNLNGISWPDIPGLVSFQGEVMHSAKWNQEYNFKNKSVGVVGGGSSAIQIVPNLQKVEGIQLSCFVRSKTWISNTFGDAAMIAMGYDPNKPEFTSEQIHTFATDPQALYNFRKMIEVSGNTIHSSTLRDSPMQKAGKEMFTKVMRERLASRPDVAAAIIPSFAVGCRRLTPGPGYLEALIAPNVTFISSPISHITATSIHLEPTNSSAPPEEIPLDAIVLATGFLPHTPPFPVIGQHSTPLSEKLAPYPQSYLSLAVDNFPNFFMMLGPNSAIGTGSLTKILEAEGDYIVKCVRKLQREDYASMCVKQERVRDWGEYCEAYFEGTVYMDECAGWYKKRGDGGRDGKGKEKERVTGLWPGSTGHALEVLRSPRWEDWIWESREGDAGNRLGWLGNGWSVTHMEGGGDPAWYLEPEFIDIPTEGTPEIGREGSLRPWCY